MSPARKNTWKRIFVGTHPSLKSLQPHFKNCDAFRDRSTQRNAPSEILGEDAPGSSHMSIHSEELKILSVYGKGEGPLATDGHGTLFTVSEVEALNSLSADHSVAKSLERGEPLVCRKELSVQQTPDTISIKVEEDIGGGLPAGEDCDAFGDRSTQRGATSESLGVVAPGSSSHMSSHSEELLQTPDTISIKVEEDIGGGMPAVEDGNDIRDCSTQRGATSESLRVDAPGSSHMSSHSGELHILSVYGQGVGPLAVDGHDTLFAASELEALSSLSADHSVAKSLNCSVRLVRLEELTGHQGCRKGRPGVLCGKVIPNNANMIVHMRTHSGEKPYKCDQCTKWFSQKGPLKRHMRTHSGERPYKCDHCTKGFRLKDHLKRHMMTHSGEKPYKCDQCTRCFSQKGPLKIHMRTHSGEKPYKCDQCTKCFSQKDILKRHMMTHSGEKPYKCDQCTKCFSLKGHLKSHMMTHSGEKPYKCDQCKKGFSLKSNLNIHMRIHSREKPYKCDQCTMRFSQKGTLKRHMRTHSGEKLYRCDQCTKGFSLKDHLKSHMMTHSGEKPYKCDQCKKGFSLKGNLNIHMRIHSGEKPYKCDQCTMRFSQKGTLKIHMRTHSGEKLYRCDQCTKGFQRKCDLKFHLRTHSGEKPCVCLHCNASYSDPSNLCVHMLKHPLTRGNGML
ncbi:zinc finger protein 436-like isoform X2 [Gadus chalcogrammus]|uniref:zinc finger protein 436-like isoform X2 n=1 Tax=Gadus chalcogrammus TaxID=1042646 RepID=UPI0024C3EBF0|nr:zinc finger protein 436-like isoform X2 [Gadus chalcogrammus]